MTTVSDDDVLLLLSMPYFILSLTVSFLLVLPAGGVFQTEPPGGCLRQALDNIRNVLSTANSGRGITYCIFRWIHPLKISTVNPSGFTVVYTEWYDRLFWAVWEMP